MNTLSYILRDLALCAAAYLTGSLPFSYIFAKLVKGVDITKQGSRNMGATNVLRTAGPVAAVFAFAGDFLKAVLFVYFARQLFPTISANTILIASVAIVLGHDFSVWAGFKGGKGVAATFGIVMMLSWPVAVVEFGLWLAIMVWRNIVSLASLIGLAALPVVALLFREPLHVVLAYTVLAALGIVRHAANIKRLVAGTELPLERSYFRRR